MFGLNDPMVQKNNFKMFDGNQDSGVKLLIFTPRNHGNMVIRTNKFNFKNAMYDTLSDGSSAKHCLATNFEVFTQAITPSHQGIQIDTQQLDTMWSFVLIFDKVGDRPSAFGAPANRKRVVLKGYFMGEPMSVQNLFMSSPPINHSALMFFTNDSTSMINMEVSQRGSKYNISSINNVDIAHGFINNHTIGAGDLFRTDVSSLAKSSALGDSSSMMSSPYAATIASKQTDESPGIIFGAQTKSPHAQFMEVAGAIDVAARDTGGGIAQWGNNDYDLGDNEFDKFMKVMNMQLARSTISISQEGLNPLRPESLGTFLARHNVTVIPCRIPQDSQFDVRPQSDINIQNVFSSLAANVISTAAADNQISKIIFRYSSWAKDTYGMRGVWQLQQAATLYQDLSHIADQHLTKALGSFRLLMEQHLWPVLNSAAGDFDLVCSYDSSNSTIIDLNFLDHQQIGGFYEVHNRLGGLINPSLGTEDTFNNNRNQMNNLCAAVAGKLTGGLTPSFNP